MKMRKYDRIRENSKIIKIARLCAEIGTWHEYIHANIARKFAHAFVRRCKAPLIIFCTSAAHTSLAPVAAVCSATLSVSSLYFNPHEHVDTVVLI